MSRTGSDSSVVDVSVEAPEVLSGVHDGLPPAPPEPPFWEGSHPPSPGPEWALSISRARLGMLIFLTFEATFFIGLIWAFLSFRVGTDLWPPVGQPRLPTIVTWVNTTFLLLSGYTMRSALRAIRVDDAQGLRRGLSRSLLLGSTFLVIQGSEWVRLIRHGLTLAGGIYGATFYTVIGCHGVHVFGAVTWLLIVLLGVRGHRVSAMSHVRVTLCAMYWYFVVGLWPILFTLVYLM